MSTKTKTNTLEKINETAKNAGLVLMTMAATAGLVELPGQHEKRAILATQPVYVQAGSRQFNFNDESNAQRRERDEAGPHYVSYSVAQRTPGRTKNH